MTDRGIQSFIQEQKGYQNSIKTRELLQVLIHGGAMSSIIFRFYL